MAKKMKLIAVIFLILSVAAILLLHFFANDFLLSLAITFSTITYHFVMRLFVGYLVNFILKNRVDYSHSWFRQRSFEEKLYKTLKVKKWKKSMPTYDPSLFSPEKHSPEEIIQAMCQAEIVHEIIIVLSFLPLIASAFFQSFWVFFITSLLSACFDFIFVIMQRYNRPRLLRIINRKNPGNQTTSR